MCILQHHTIGIYMQYSIEERVYNTKYHKLLHYIRGERFKYWNV